MSRSTRHGSGPSEGERWDAVRPVRLDLTTNPYGPALGVPEALAGLDDLHLPDAAGAASLRDRLAGVLGVAPAGLLLADGIDRLLIDLFAWLRPRGPLVVFPPSDPVPIALARLVGCAVEDVVRTPRFDLGVDPATLATLPPGWNAYVQSPNDPTGTILATDEAVRLARRAGVLIIDERHGAYSPRTLLPIAREFDNVIVVRTMETWAGLSGLPLAYAIVPARLRAGLATARPVASVARAAVVAGRATLDDLGSVLTSLRQVRTERARLYRTLRKLNMVSVPYPTWAGFLLVRSERSDAATIVDGLAARGVLVAPVRDPELGVRTFRVSAGRPEETDRLRDALVAIGLRL